MALTSDRVALDHTTLMVVERKIEEIDDHVQELTREVDGLDIYPSCDCSCDEDIRDLQSDLASALTRISALEDQMDDIIASATSHLGRLQILVEKLRRETH